MSDDHKAASRTSDRDTRSDEGAKPDEISADDRHKTEKLASHDGVDPNAGQE